MSTTGNTETASSEVSAIPQKDVKYYSIPDLAQRWRCSRGTVYNRLRFARAKVLDFSAAGRKSKKLVPALTVFQLEAKYTKILP
jgi:predicted DNA-binding protein (UPF0251 family)